MDLAYNSIRESILAGNFKPGEHLIEGRIAADLEISRAPIREAMQRLTQEGLTVEKPRRGVYVSEIEGSDLVDIYNARIAIECVAVRLAVRNGASLAPIEATIEAMKKSAARGDLPKTIDLELRMHEQICEASGNSYVAQIYRSLAGPVRVALGMDDAAYENLEDIATEHVPLLEAMRQGDADLAEKAMHDHITSTVGPVLEGLGADPLQLLSRADA